MEDNDLDRIDLAAYHTWLAGIKPGDKVGVRVSGMKQDQRAVDQYFTGVVSRVLKTKIVLSSGGEFETRGGTEKGTRGWNTTWRQLVPWSEKVATASRRRATRRAAETALKAIDWETISEDAMVQLRNIAQVFAKKETQ